MIVGAADGDLGRHTAIDSNDYPIVTNGTIVLEKVRFTPTNKQAGTEMRPHRSSLQCSLRRH